MVCSLFGQTLQNYQKINSFHDVTLDICQHSNTFSTISRKFWEQNLIGVNIFNTDWCPCVTSWSELFRLLLSCQSILLPKTFESWFEFDWILYDFCFLIVALWCSLQFYVSNVPSQACTHTNTTVRNTSIIAVTTPINSLNRKYSSTLVIYTEGNHKYPSVFYSFSLQCILRNNGQRTAEYISLIHISW